MKIMNYALPFAIFAFGTTGYISVRVFELTPTLTDVAAWMFLLVALIGLRLLSLEAHR